MAIPRLPPATNPISVSLDVNVKLSPYFTQYYQDTKQAGDTPEAFLLRVMKQRVVEHYKLNYVDTQIKAARDVYLAAIDAIKADANAISTEVD